MRIFVTLIMLTALLPISAHAWPIPDSGQTKCYNDTAEIPCPAPGEDFYGQDGNYLINPPSYTKLDASGNDLPDDAASWVMVRDNVTGLVWEVKTYDNYSYTWDSSNDFTYHLCVGYYCDWRLPTVKELASIINLVAYSPAIDNAYFPKTLSSGYWSSTIYADNTIHAWYVNFTNGDEYDDVKSSIRYVRAVRSGQVRSFNSVIINNDGTVSDTCTGLMWQKYAGGSMTWKDSLSFCESLTLAGYSDWRLPTREELRSLVDYGKYNPAVDTSAFPDIFSLNYWSSTTYIDNTNDAWDVYFAYGDSYNYNKSSSRYVRAVRGGQIHLPNHLLITFPNQASFWGSGNTMPVKWETQNIGGNVKITLSRDGGKTFETITESTPNDGSYDWTVNGAASFNCALKIEPLNDTSKSTVQSLFTITSPPLVSLSLSPSSISENGGTATLTATLDKTSADDVTVNLSFRGLAMPPGQYSDYSISSPFIVINAGTTVGTVQITGVDDIDNEIDETFTVSIESVENGIENGEQEVSGTILDDDGVPTVTLTLDPVSISENGGTATLTARLDSSSYQNVAVYFSFKGGAEKGVDYVSSSDNCIISPGSNSGSIMITGINDSAIEGNETFTIDISSVLGGTANGSQQVTGTIIDDDEPPNDTTPPTAPTFKSSLPSVSTWTNGNTITVSWNPGTDSDSGVAGYSYIFDTSPSTAPDNIVETDQTQMTSPALADGDSHYFHIRTVDNAGNVSDTLHVGPFRIDTTPPTGNISINSGAASTDSQNVTLSLSVTDSGSGLSQMQFSNDNMNWSSPENYSTSAVWALTSGEGSKTVYARFSDTLGNLSEGTISDEITYAPSAAYPPDPTGLVIEKKDDSQISLKWNQISSPSGITYAVFRSRSENGIYYKVNSDDIDASDAFQGKVYYTDRHLENGTTYYYKIRSFLNGTGSQNFSNTVSATPKGPEDYEINIVEADRIINIYGSVVYNIQIIPKENFSGSLLLTCPVSDGLTPLFSLNGTESGTSLNNLVPPASVSLKITAGSLAQTGVHLLTLRAMNTVSGELRETFLHLTVVSNSGSGIYANVEKEIIPKGEKTVIYGGLFPNIPDRPVILTLDKQGEPGIPKSKNVRTDQYGKFRETEWIATLAIGEYTLQASWTDDMSQTRESQIIPFTVEKGISRLTCLRKSSAEPEIGLDFSVNGNLSPALSYPIITLRITDPDGQFSDISVQQDISASWESTRNFFNRRGIWKFRSYWPGNADYTGCESDELIIPVGTDAGRVIILGGGLADQQNTYWQSTVRFCTDVYRNFRRKGFTDDMIHLLINSDMIDINWNGQADDGVTDSNPPTAAAFLDVIENEFSAELNEETPLYIYMQGHGTSDGRFKVLGDDEFVTAAEIGQAMDSIQLRTGCKVILILESCYSGNFIPELSGENRVIVTSAGGEPYNTDESGNISFSAFLFSKLMEGDHFKKAFDAAGDNLTAVNYPAPALDDNDDKKYDFSDGLLAADTWLTGNLSWGLKPVVMEAEAAQVLEGASELPIRVKITAGDTQTQRVWAQLIAPDANITGGNSTIAYPESALLLIPASGLYEGTLRGLYRAGLWKIVIYAEESDHDVSDPFVIWVSASGMPGPGDISGDGKVDLADAVKGLRILCGAETPAADITHADADGDGDVGLEEIIFILREVSGQ